MLRPLCLFFLVLYPTTTVVALPPSRPGLGEPPKPPMKAPDRSLIPAAVHPENFRGSANNGEDIPNTSDSSSSGSGSNAPLFSTSNRLTDLAYLVSGLLGDFASLSGNGSTTPISTSSTGTATSSTGIATPSKGTVLATSTTTPIAVLGCSIFQSYMSLCSWTVSGSHSSIALDSSALASCACYSSTYYVPDALDSAALACARYTAGSTSTATNTNLAAATTASSFTGFCAGMSNVRDYPSAEFAKATEPPTSSPSVTAESESNDGRRLGVSEVPVLIVIATFITLLL